MISMQIIKKYLVACFFLLIICLSCSCSISTQPYIESTPSYEYDRVSTDNSENDSIPELSQDKHITNVTPNSETVICADEFSNQSDIRPTEGYPRIANLWGIVSQDDDPTVYSGFDLFIPYSLVDPARQIAELRALNTDIKILHYQYATKGRPEIDPIFKEWWNSKPDDPGYNCFFRDVQKQILLVKIWEHPMVNMTVPYCKQVMVQKNIRDFKSSAFSDKEIQIYDGIYWDLLFDRISWLGADIDSNLDGIADDPDSLDLTYKENVINFLSQIRDSLPGVTILGNEASLAYSDWVDGRLFEWQLSNLLDGAEWLTWEESVSEYIDWSVLANNKHMTIIQSGPSVSITDKYSINDLEEIPLAILTEAEASYQRMRYGLTSALMGNGLFSFDYGPMIHGYPWWYDEYGSPAGSLQSSLPYHGYLGQPSGDSHPMTGEPEIWARSFQNGMVLVNPSKNAHSISLEGCYCKIKGTQAPLFEVIIDDDRAQLSGRWVEQRALMDQFGTTVHLSLDETKAIATYTPSLAYSGQYEVFAWIDSKSDQESSGVVSVYHANGNTEVALAQSSGVAGWQSVGVFDFNAGKNGFVELRTDRKHTIIADAYKWVSIARYNDGLKVSQLTLQPQDGIILLACQP